MFTIDYAKISRADSDVIDAIYNRAAGMGLNGNRRKPYFLMMDLFTVHSTLGLRLTEMLEGNAQDFAHDICGIQQHLDRTTGQLLDCFIPRFAINQ